MTTITASLVQELRERTGAGMMECKKALVNANGDIETAIEAMRKAGQAKADKKEGRVAAEGIIVVKNSSDNKSAAIIEINCETDFVGRDESFKEFATKTADKALAGKATDLNALLVLPLDNGMTVEEARRALVAKIGENIQIRRISAINTSGTVASYVHGGRIGVLVELTGGDAQLGKDLAMHIAANNPLVVNREEVSKDVVEKEKEIFSAQAQASGKPAAIIEKMIGGRISKFLDEVSLVGQPFVKDPSITVEQLLKQHNAKVVKFIRFAVGEGIEKQADNFVAEVMAQVRGS
jgi:elongation factor Ts